MDCRAIRSRLACLEWNPSVRRLCTRSASLITSTRKSAAAAGIILRNVSASACSPHLAPSSLVTPSTRTVTSSPNSAWTCPSVKSVSSTVSCSSAAASVAVSTPSCASTIATASGCVTYGAPDLRICPGGTAPPPHTPGAALPHRLAGRTCDARGSTARRRCRPLTATREPCAHQTREPHHALAGPPLGRVSRFHRPTLAATAPLPGYNHYRHDHHPRSPAIIVPWQDDGQPTARRTMRRPCAACRQDRSPGRRPPDGCPSLWNMPERITTSDPC